MVSAESLNEDVLERIFTFLDFKDLLQAELCCLKVFCQLSEEEKQGQTVHKTVITVIGED